MNEDMWTSRTEEAHAVRVALATVREISNNFAQYVNGLQHVLNGDPYAGMTVARQLSLSEELARTAEALRNDCVARSAAVDEYGARVLSLLEGTHDRARVPYSDMVDRWGASDGLTLTLKEFLREALIDFAQHGSGAAYWITPKGTLKLRKITVNVSPERRAVGGDGDV